MKLIEQSVKVLKQENGEIGVYKQVEKAARLCYKSEDKTTENSYENFIKMLKENGHNSPFEHGTVYLTIDDWDEVYKYTRNKYSKVAKEDSSDDIYYITTNYRVIKENGWEDDLKYLCEPTEHHVKRISVHIVTDRAISHELVRHRVFSFSQESQRYCNYSKDKFGNDVTFIIPNWVNTHCPNEENEGPSIADTEWSTAMLNAETSYFNLLKEGWKPQEARTVLPNSTKTELIMTGFETQWEEFFKLRCSKAAHPMMQELANKIKEVING